MKLNLCLLAKYLKMNDEEIRKRFEKIERRLDLLEGVDKKIKKNLGKKNYKGLAGGIRFLIDNIFFDSPKSLKEIIDELKREGYHYSKSGVASTLSTTFVKSQRILNRIKEDKSWKYAIRK